MLSNSSLYTDKELFSLIAANDHAAFTELLERHQSNIYLQAVAFLKNPFKAQDIVQEVFLSIWNIRHTLEAVENPQNYLFIIARNKIISEFKKKVHSSIPDGMEEIHAGSDLPFDQKLENKDLLRHIQSAVDQMPPQRKQVFELGKRHGLKYEEIAEKLNISPNTVKVHMVQALAFIRHFLRNRVTIFLIFSLF